MIAHDIGTEDSNVTAASRSTIDYNRLRIAINQLAEVNGAIAAQNDTPTSEKLVIFDAGVKGHTKKQFDA